MGSDPRMASREKRLLLAAAPRGASGCGPAASDQPKRPRPARSACWKARPVATLASVSCKVADRGRRMRRRKGPRPCQKPHHHRRRHPQVSMWREPSWIWERKLGRPMSANVWGNAGVRLMEVTKMTVTTKRMSAGGFVSWRMRRTAGVCLGLVQGPYCWTETCCGGWYCYCRRCGCRWCCLQGCRSENHPKSGTGQSV